MANPDPRFRRVVRRGASLAIIVDRHRPGEWFFTLSREFSDQ
jgi:hypothetical protein